MSEETKHQFNADENATFKNEIPLSDIVSQNMSCMAHRILDVVDTTPKKLHLAMAHVLAGVFALSPEHSWEELQRIVKQGWDDALEWRKKKEEQNREFQKAARQLALEAVKKHLEEQGVEVDVADMTVLGEVDPSKLN
jgi:hypothetical protein